MFKLSKRGVWNIIPDIDNWVKFCLGKELFEVIKKKYYCSLDSLKNACNKLDINDSKTYTKYHKKDSKLPPCEFINEGFYKYLDKNFNLTQLIDTDIDIDYIWFYIIQILKS